MQSGVVENWALSVDQCQLQVLQFSVPLIHFLSILLRCNGFTGIQKAMGFSSGTSGNLPASAGDLRDPGSIPGSGRPSGGEPGKPPQHSCLENPMDRGVWCATVHGVAKSQTWLKQLSVHTESYSGWDWQHVTKPWPFLVHVCFGKYFGASPWSNHWARHHWLSYKNPFSLHITI